MLVESLPSEPPGKPIPTRDLCSPYGVDFLKKYVGCIPVAGNERRRERKRQRERKVSLTSVSCKVEMSVSHYKSSLWDGKNGLSWNK